MDFAPLLLLSDRNVVTSVLGRRNVWEGPVAGIQLCLTPSGALHNHVSLLLGKILNRLLKLIQDCISFSLPHCFIVCLADSRHPLSES